MKLTLKSLTPSIIGAVMGAGLGYAYWYYVGCSSGACPITSSPVISTIYGSIMGLFLVQSFTKSSSK